MYLQSVYKEKLDFGYKRKLNSLVLNFWNVNAITLLVPLLVLQSLPHTLLSLTVTTYRLFFLNCCYIFQNIKTSSHITFACDFRAHHWILGRFHVHTNGWMWASQESWLYLPSFLPCFLTSFLFFFIPFSFILLSYITTWLHSLLPSQSHAHLLSPQIHYSSVFRKRSPPRAIR